MLSSILLTTLFVAAFLVLITFVAGVHEIGHLLAAKLSGIKVFEFSLGFGPKIFQIKHNDTVYSIRPLPLGGFVRIAGIDFEDEAEGKSYKEEQSFKSRSFLQKFLVIIAGPMANIVAAFLIFSIIFLAIGIPGNSNEIGSVLPGSPAEKAGIKVGDKITAISNIKTDDDGSILQGIKLINKSSGKQLAIKIDRFGTTKVFKVAPEYDPKAKIGRIGVGFKMHFERKAFWLSFFEGLKWVFILIVGFLYSLYSLFVGQAPVSDLMGPFGIAMASAEAAKAGIYDFVWLLAMISGAIGLANLVPLPPLDGGRVLFLIVEAIIRKPLNIKVEKAITTMGWVLLIILMITATKNDITRIITRHW